MGQEKPVNPDKVAIYIRWSTDDQADGTTLEVQQEGCRHYVLSQGWRVNPALVFIDDGYSGGTLQRPALTGLRALVRAGQVDCVVVLKLDRLSRSVVDMVKLVLEEWDGLTHVRSAREPLDTSSAMGRQFFYMLVSFAEWERSVIRERTTAGRLARAREGYKPGSRAPYGYRHGATTGSYEPDPAEAAVVGRIFELYARGIGARGVVTRLNAEGVPFRGGQPWNERTVLYLLSNPIYIGRAVYGRLSRNPRRGKAPGEAFWLRGERVTIVEQSPFVPPIVSSELFALAQQLKAGRRHGPAAASPRAVSSPYLVTGLVRCRCGSSLYVRTQASGHRQYACLGKKTRGAVFCDAAAIPQDLLERRVQEELLSRFGDRVGCETYTGALLHSLSREMAETEALLSQVRQRVAALESQERRLRLAYREQQITAAEFRTLRRDCLHDLGEARASGQQLDSRRAALAEQRQGRGVRVQAMGQADRWSELTPAEQKNLVRCFVAAMTAWTDPTTREVHLQIDWRTD